jgi:hypothetical protein
MAEWPAGTNTSLSPGADGSPARWEQAPPRDDGGRNGSLSR